MACFEAIEVEMHPSFEDFGECDQSKKLVQQRVFRWAASSVSAQAMHSEAQGMYSIRSEDSGPSELDPERAEARSSTL